MHSGSPQCWVDIVRKRRDHTRLRYAHSRLWLQDAGGRPAIEGAVTIRAWIPWLSYIAGWKAEVWLEILLADAMYSCELKLGAENRVGKRKRPDGSVRQGILRTENAGHGIAVLVSPCDVVSVELKDELSGEVVQCRKNESILPPIGRKKVHAVIGQRGEAQIAIAEPFQGVYAMQVADCSELAWIALCVFDLFFYEGLTTSV